MREINPIPSYIPNGVIEAKTASLIRRYSKEIEPVYSPPVPVEKIAELLLDLKLDWSPIDEESGEIILAYIQPSTNTITFNENHIDHFEDFIGTREFTIGHELGHYELHLTDWKMQSLLSEDEPVATFLCRQTTKLQKDSREWQADRFASYLLMPETLLRQEVKDMDLYNWKSLYKLRDKFNVSVKALQIRLQQLGWLQIEANKTLQNAQETKGQLRLF